MAASEQISKRSDACRVAVSAANPTIREYQARHRPEHASVAGFDAHYLRCTVTDSALVGFAALTATLRDSRAQTPPAPG